jgi:ribose 5-phosphate isomerase A
LAKEALKRAAGYHAVSLVSDGMSIGLGSGSTARYATLCIADKLRRRLLRDIVAVPTSEETAALARDRGIPLTTLEERGQLDITIDGADEVDPQLNAIKGLGGCLLREKIVAFASKRLVIVVDDSKLVSKLGSHSPVPVEVIRFGWRNTERALQHTGARTALRLKADAPFLTDEDNYIVDCWYDGIDSPEELASLLNSIPGVVENGLFVGMAHTVVVASRDEVRVLER